ncbi:MAG: DUF3822 family protein [Saprospiraceae bacterium]
MGIINTNIIEDSFAKKDASKYNLSILIGMDRFSYAILDDENHLLALKSYLINADLKASKKLHPALQDLFIEDDVLKLPFQKKTVGFINNKTTFVPNKFFQEKEVDTYLSKQVGSLEADQIFVDEVELMGAKNVYAFDQEVYFLVKGYLPNARFIHNATSVLQGFSFNQNNSSGKKVYVNVKGDHLQIALFDNQEMVFYNSFAFQNEQDFIYQVMLVFNQFRLSTDSNPVILSGQITKDSKIYRMLFRYINKIQFSKAPSAIQLGGNYHGIPTHFFFDLFSLGLCE